MSNNSFIEECFKIIKDKNIDFLYSGHPLGMKFSESTSKLRLCLQRMETEEYGQTSRPRISDSRNVRRDITSKYQLDYLRDDIIQISNQFAISIAQALYFLPNTSEIKYSYFYNKSDSFYWYNIDNGYKIASSGWDRISFLLNLAFNLGIEKYNLSNVLAAIANKIDGASKNDNFKSLKKFRDGEFKELEHKLSEGIRHEVIHIITRPTRFWCELLEQIEHDEKYMVKNRFELEEKRANEVKLLEEHYKHFLTGIDDSLDLVESFFDEKFFK